MSYIVCPKCGMKYHQKAVVCPKCKITPEQYAQQAAKEAQKRQAAPQPAAVVTIEATGKKWKLAKLLGVLGLGLGVLLVIGGLSTEAPTLGTVGLFLVLGGLMSYILGRVGAWWYHG